MSLLLRKKFVFQSVCLSLDDFYFLAEYFADFLGRSYHTLEDEFGYHDAPFDDVSIDVPEPACIDHFDAL
jgi:hypothetical protein